MLSPCGELLFFDGAQRKGNQKKGRFSDQNSIGERVGATTGCDVDL
jgi:hypothetical protein